MIKRNDRITPEEAELVLQRSLIYRQAEKDLQGAAAGSAGEGKARAACTEARRKWRDATDQALKKPP